MPRIKVTRTHYATVEETTIVHIDVPEGEDPAAFLEYVESDDLHEDPMESAENSAHIQYDNDDPEDGPVSRERPVFVGSEQCYRSFDWCDYEYEYQITE